MIKFKKRNFGLLFLSIIFLSNISARLPIGCFNGFQKLFENDKVFTNYPELNPALGFVFCGSSLASNLRFYGNYKFGWGKQPGDQDEAPEHRIYSLDDPLDPIAFVIKELFPSVGGTLTTSVERDENIGHRLLSANRENQLKALALLLSFVVKCRSGQCQKGEYGEYVNSLQDLIGGKNNKKKFVKFLNKFFLNISEAISEPIFVDNNFYPKYLTEQIVLGFTWEFLNTKEELSGFLTELKQYLSGGQQERIIIEEFDRSSLEQLTTKIEDNLEDCNYEELLLYQLFSEMFNSPTPYRSGEILFSNSKCKMYDSLLGIKTEKLFADCNETTIRHLTNIALFNTFERRFKCPDNCSEFVKSFYKKYHLSSSSDGSTECRSDWNKAIACLNEDQKDNFYPVIYLKSINAGNPNNNEIKSGFLNLINVLSRLLKQEALTKEQHASFLDNPQSAIDFFSKLFNKDRLLNINVDIFNLSKQNTIDNQHEDLFGVVYFSIGAQKFNLSIINGHSKLSCLASDSNTGGLVLRDAFNDKLKASFGERTDLLSAFESTLLLIPSWIEKDKIHSFYYLNRNQLVDSFTKITFLEELFALKLYPQALFDLFLFKNEIMWEDYEVEVRGNAIVFEILKYQNMFLGLSIEDLAKYKEKLELENLIINSLPELQKGLKKLVIQNCRNLTTESINSLVDSQIEELELIGLNICSIPELPKSLKKLSINSCSNLTTESMNSLVDSQIEELKLIGFNIFPELPESLKKLSIIGCRNLTTESLKIISDSKIEEISLFFLSIDNIPKIPESLKKLIIVGCNNLTSKSLEIISDSKIEEIELKISRIDSIRELPKSLKKLAINHCHSLITESVNELVNFQIEDLELSNLIINKIPNLPKTLKNLKIFQCDSLTSESTNELINLKIEDLELSNLNINMLPGLPKTLKKLNINRCNNLTTESLNMVANLQIKELELVDLNINMLPNLSKNLKRLKIDSCNNLTSESLNMLDYLQIEELELNDLNIDSLPESLKKLKLGSLHKTLSFLNQNKGSIGQLEELNCSDNFIIKKIQKVKLRKRPVKNIINQPVRQKIRRKQKVAEKRASQTLDATLTP